MATQESDFCDQIWALMLDSDKANFQLIIENNPSLMHLRNQFHMTLLHFAARTGDWPAIKILIANGADLADTGGPLGTQTALHFAAMKGSPFVIALTVWALRVHQKNYLSLLSKVLPNTNEAALFTQINRLQGEDFTSLLTQIIQQTAPERLQRITSWKNKISDSHLVNALISISEQMPDIVVIPPTKPLIHPDSPILSHNSLTVAPTSTPPTPTPNGYKF